MEVNVEQVAAGVDLVEVRQDITGVIRSRRCHGKHLSFATIIADDADNSTKQKEDAVIKVMFRRAAFDGGDQPETNFPTKTSALPYGAKVKLQVVNVGRESLEVRSWGIIGEHPRDKALQTAKETSGGVSCTKYLQSRGDAFLNLHGDRLKNLASKRKLRSSNNQQQHKDDNYDVKANVNVRDNDIDNDAAHGSAQVRGQRVKIFAKWLVETIPSLRTTPQSQSQCTKPPRILDVAGGKGNLSCELAKSGIVCTVIDPLVRSKRNMKRLVNNRRKDSHATTASIPSFIHARFEQDQATEELLANNAYTCLVGFHPDECTEDILDMALRHNKVFAIVPCCVFPSFFPLRKLENGTMVQSYQHFIEYLLQKDSRLQRATLPFEGKNQVIYLSSLDSAAPCIATTTTNNNSSAVHTKNKGLSLGKRGEESPARVVFRK